MRCVFLQRFFVTLALLRWIVAPAAADIGAQELPGVHNFFRATTNVFSGSQPEGDAGFATLVKLGVKTVISVDGARPDVELAAQHELNYVHLPFGYDGIPASRVAELARAAAVLPGPVYVHCHHGKHRGPAAVSVICLADAGWTPAQAEEFMHQAGTGAEYPGLYRTAREFRPLTARQLLEVSTNFPSVARTSSLVEAMVAVDQIYEHLKQAQQAGWKTPADHPDVAPAHEVVLLWEQFRELERTEDTAGRPADYRDHLKTACRAVEELRNLLRPAHSDPVAATTALNRVGQSCAGCHRRYRNE